MEWKNLEIQDKEIVDEYTKGKFITCDYNFSNQILWSIGEKTKYKVEDNILLIKGIYENEEYYYMPIPKDESVEVLNTWKEKIKNIINENKRIILVPEYWKNLLEDTFILEERRESFDYIYNSQDLGTLKGRKYSKKKNRINNFNKLYSYTYETIDEKNICEVIKFQEEWCQNRECYSIPVLNNENIGIMHILHNFDKLDLIGAMIKIDGKVIAYSLGEVLNDEYAVIHIEKGLNNYIGSYQMINYLFAQNEFSKCKYINREDDFGDEGLREAKESYHPAFLLKKYEIVGIK
ncbi:phosphatidylglycerol lysyltransferase domain-containing protein [uncultured Fusobacterium sp.]|jgi:hypothetical protein|uniref:DUF2156 domain-containing protein n=1 Tax=uncultured Fusobacterium sp. TaxID=159267 RepID=UPI0025FEA451|nr:phosphatidylglycerol lysyltransferase domain-containing protein [uncultured Fusobacterium sp.]